LWQEDGVLTPKTVDLLQYIKNICKNTGLKLQSCAEKSAITELGIASGACINKEVLETMGVSTQNMKKDPYQRPECRCLSSVDIGRYGTCPAGCVYCYAR
jgi:hypothetical protein